MQGVIAFIWLASASVGCGGKNLLQDANDSSNRRRDAQAQSGSPTPSSPTPGQLGPDVSPSTPPANANAPLASVSQLEDWCTKAAQTKPIQGKLNTTFGHLCAAGKPSELLRETLVKRAYSGGENIQFVDLEPMQSDRSTLTTFYTFAVGIKIPIPIKTHFEKVAPKAGDAEEAAKLASLAGAKGEGRVEKEYKGDGPFHVRGWSIWNRMRQQFIITSVELESRNRVDHFALKDGEDYLYTQYIEEIISGALRLDIVTAGLQIGSDSYLLSAVSFKVDNKGFAPIAETKLKETAVATIKHMFELANVAPNSP